MYLKQDHPPSVSASEIAVWKQCRQKWYWQYYLRIQPARTHTKLAQGTMAHAGIAAALRGTPISSAVEASAIEQKRGAILELDGEEFGPEGSQEEIEHVSECVRKWDRESNLRERELVASELEWEAPVLDGRRRLTGVNWTGRMDALINIGGYGTESWGLEAKFVGRFRTEESIELSSQLALYLLHMQQVLGIAHPKLLYVQILNKAPAIPVVNKSGGISRSPISTDWDTYRDTVMAHGYDPEDYADMREKLSGKRFWSEQVVTRSTERLAVERGALYDVTADIMAKRKRIYMCDSPFLCSSCQFRDLCLENVRGRDPMELIETGAYVSRDKPLDDAEVTTDGD